MSDLRSKTPQQFGAHKVKVFEDYSNGTTKDFEFNLSFAAQLPQCNVLRFTFSEGGNSSVIVRPSGTEPKLKLYISASAKNLRKPSRKPMSCFRRRMPLLRKASKADTDTAPAHRASPQKAAGHKSI